MFKNISLVLLVSIITLKVADYSFGLIQPRESLSSSVNRATTRSIVLREFNPDQNAMVTPSNRLVQQSDSLQQIPQQALIDKNGFLDNGNPIETNPTIRIIFFGGSTTENLFVPVKERFSSVVERSLRANTDHRVVTHNAGVSGNNVMHSFLSFAAKGIPLKPNFVVLMHNVNDLSILSKTESYWKAPSMRALVAGDKTSLFANQDSSKGLFFYFLRSIKNTLFPNLYAYLWPRLFQSSIMNADEFTHFRGELPDVNLSDAKIQFRSSLISFVQLAKAWKIQPILMTQANRIDTGDIVFQRLLETSPDIGMEPDIFESIYKDFNRIIREVAIQESIPLIDLDLLIQPSEKYLYDTVHFNSEGSMLAGKIISDYFVGILSDELAH